MTDLIERQAAIEIVDRYDKSHMILKGKPMLGAASIVIELEALPSANLDISGFCDRLWKSAYDRGYERCRQDAIDAIDKHIDTFDAIDTNYFCGLRTAMSFLKEIPSAQPEIIRCKGCENCADAERRSDETD